jgi:two-component system OmpR family sensor kinase
VSRRLPIRLRLAITSALLVLIVLVIAGSTVVVLERRSLDAGLEEQAMLEARSLLAVASRDDVIPPTDAEQPGTTGSAEGDDDGDEGAGEERPDDMTEDAVVPPRSGVTLDPNTESYLVRRSASDSLLAVRAPRAAAVVNTADARDLIAYLDAPDGTRVAQIDDDEYTVAVARDAGGITAAAAISREEAAERIAEVVQALLIAGAVGLILTLSGAWLAARSALRPLTTMTRRAEAVTAGRLDSRVGPIAGDDEIARLTRAIDDMLARLEASFDAQQRFVQDASHELRTPITIARGHLEVTDPRDEDPAAVQAAITLAIDEMQRMGDLVERLLVLARAGELPAGRLRHVRANALGDDALARVRGNAERRWEITHDNADPQVLCEQDALVDVLVNLLRNAERHTEPGGRISLAIRADDDHVTLTVQDDGEGIPPELLPTIFDRFTRADAARNRDAGGAGLGLAISRAYVEAHGGTITVTSAPGAGAAFMIALPRIA